MLRTMVMLSRVFVYSVASAEAQPEVLPGGLGWSNHLVPRLVGEPSVWKAQGLKTSQKLV